MIIQKSMDAFQMLGIATIIKWFHIDLFIMILPRRALKSQNIILYIYNDIKKISPKLIAAGKLFWVIDFILYLKNYEISFCHYILIKIVHNALEKWVFYRKKTGITDFYGFQS